jgi:hypothetical protein
MFAVIQGFGPFGALAATRLSLCASMAIRPEPRTWRELHACLRSLAAGVAAFA